MAPTPRQQLLRRRDTYLARVSTWDWNPIPLEWDNRPALVRGFRGGGADTPPACLPEDKRGEPRRLHRPPRPSPDGDASRRLQSDRTSHGDYEVFALAPLGEIGISRITAILARAVKRWRPGATAEPHHYFDVGLATLPASLDETGNALAVAWTLFERVGLDTSPLLASVLRILDRAPWALDPWTVSNPPADDKCKDRYVDLKPVVVAAVTSKLSSYTGPNHVPWPKYPPGTDPAGGAHEDPCACEKPKPEGPPGPQEPACPPPKVLNVDASLDAAVVSCADALLAAFGDDPDPDCIADLRELGMPDPVIARLFFWMHAVWKDVDEEQRRSQASYAWNAAHGLMPFHGGRVSLEWEAAVPAVYALRVLARLSRLTIREACVQLVALMNSTLLDGWALNSRHGAAGVWKEVDKAIAEARRPLDPAGRKEAAPYRLAARMRDAETYDRVLHDGMRPAAEIPASSGAAAGLASPGLTPLDAYYWRWVVMRSTFTHTLALSEDADFGVMEHTRFLGLFRPGGTLRPAPGDPAFDQQFEDWIAALVPDWFVRFAIASLLRYKFWIDDDPTPRSDRKEQVFWSENHQISFASSELVAGLTWKHEPFWHQHRGVTRTGQWHADRALQRAERWLRHRLQFGFSEVNSPVYYNVQIPALLNLIDFLPVEQPGGTRDEALDRVRTLALMVLDVLVFDVVLRLCQGSFVTASPRGYLSGRTSGWGVSIRDFIEILTGRLGEITGTGEQSAVCLATSRYVHDVPDCLLAIAAEQSVPFVAKTRTSINLNEGIDYGIGVDSAEDIMFWWGHSAFFTPQTYRASQSWSVRWNLRNTEPFNIFDKVDGAVMRILHAIVGGLSTFAMWSGLQAFYPPLALLMTPRAIRSAVDVITSVLDLVAAGIDLVGKELGLLDENNDRVRLARTAVEQEFERALIEFNAGSVMEREHLYVWRSADAMLSSMVDEQKQKISAQKLTCVASLGPDVSVFVGKPLESDIDLETYLEAGAAGAEEYLEFWKTVPGAMGIGQEPVAPEVGELGRVMALHVEEKSIFAAGPTYWNGDVSSPLVWQHENVAIAIHHPTAHQKDISANTHAHWPWDHFDEVHTTEASGGRWVFGRRDRRFPPRTPCRPRSEFRPSAQEPWPTSAHRRDADPSNGGAGYVALFSAAGLKTRPSDPSDPLSEEDKEKKDVGWGHRELIADGHDNVWILAVGDELTYGDFTTFRERILACELDADVGEGSCVFELPTLSGPKLKLDVHFENGGRVHEPATAESPLAKALVLETRFWPRYMLTPSTFASTAALRFGVRGGEHLTRQFVDWTDARWTIHATVQQPDPADPDTLQDVEISVHHDFREGLPPRRIVRNAAPAPAADDFSSLVSEGLDQDVAVPAAADRNNHLPAQSTLGASFRAARRDTFAAVRRRS